MTLRRCCTTNMIAMTICSRSPSIKSYIWEKAVIRQNYDNSIAEIIQASQPFGVLQLLDLSLSKASPIIVLEVTCPSCISLSPGVHVFDCSPVMF